jgi:serine phosphatase RsbU (regulator of sigma subunit)
MGGWIVFTSIFTKNFLGLYRKNSKSVWLMNFLVVIGIFTMISHFLFGYAFSIRSGAASVGFASFVMISVSIWAYFQNVKAARFFLLAWLLLLCGVLMIVFARFGILPFNFFTTHGVEAGSSLEVILLSFALGEKFRLILLENQQIQEKSFKIEREAKESLEMRVRERTQSLQEAMEELNQTNEELTSTLEIVQNQKIEIEKKNTDLTAGITYAKRIQQAFLPPQSSIRSRIPEFLLFFRPRDIVSGDFYWYKEMNENTAFLAVADCTGHGVPGALMSMIGVNLLSEIIAIRGIESPADILTALNFGVIAALHQEESQNRDGMVISLLKIDFAEKKVLFAGAKHGLLVVKSPEDWQFVKGNRLSIGDILEKKTQDIRFDEHLFAADERTFFYTYSDGFPDQFGGVQNKKFKYERLNQLLVANAHLPVNEQKNELEAVLKDWLFLGKQMQIDDILVCGFTLQSSGETSA